MSLLPAETSDEKLIEDARRGRREAFDALTERHFGLVYAVALARLRDRERAEDLAQEVFLRVYLQLDRMGDVKLFSHWVVRVARNLVIDWQRQGERAKRLLPMVPLDDLPNELPAGEADNDARQRAAARERAAALQKTMERLSPEEREIVLLYYMEGLSQRSIAERLGIDHSTVSRKLGAALAQIRELIEVVLREQAAGLRPRRSAVLRVGAAVTALAALSGATRQSMAAVAAAQAATANTTATSSASGFTPLARSLLSSIKTGGALMGTTKTLGILFATALVAVCGYRHLTRPLPGDNAALRAIPSRHANMAPPRAPAASRKATQPSPGRNPSHAVALDSESTRPRLLVTGRVTLKGAVPAPGARVELLKYEYPSGDFPSLATVAQTTTNRGGLFSMHVDYVKEPLIRFSCPGAATLLEALPVSSSQYQGTRRLMHSAELPPAAKLSGRIEREDGKPVSGATIKAMAGFSRPGVLSAAEERVLYSTDGSFSLEDLPEGEVRLVAEDGEHAPARETVTAPTENVVLRMRGKGASIRGRVVLENTRHGVQGATVTLVGLEEFGSALYPAAHHKAISVQDGAFAFDHLAPGLYMAQPFASGLFALPVQGAEQRAFRLAAEESTSGLELVMYPGHTVTGSVTERQTGKAISGVRIVLNDPGDKSTTHAQAVSAADGTFRVTQVTGAMVQGRGLCAQLRAEKPGYLLVHSDSGQDGDGDFVELGESNSQTVVNLQMMRSVKVSGTVVTADGTSVPGALVTLVKNTAGNAASPAVETLSDAAGSFAIEAEPYTLFRLKAQVARKAPAYSDVVNLHDKPLSGVRIEMVPGGAITGTVVDQAGNPVEAASVSCAVQLPIGKDSACEEKEFLETDKLGEFSIPTLAPTAYRLSASKTGFAPSDEVTVQVECEKTGPGVTLRLKQSHYIAGKVTDEVGKPVTGAQVGARGGKNPADALTNTKGLYRLEGLGGGPFTLYAWRGSSVPARKENVTVDQDNVDFVLNSGAQSDGSITFTGHVIDTKTRAPIREFTVTSRIAKAVRKIPERPGTFTAKLEKLQTCYDFHIEAKGHAPLDTGVRERPLGDAPLEETFALGAGGRLVGRVVDRQSGQPLDGATVQVKSAIESLAGADAGPLQTVTTKADGRFRFDGLSEGTNHITLVPPQSDMAVARSFVIVDEKETDAGDIVVGRACTIRGRVVRASKPVEGASLVLKNDSSPQTRQGRTDANGAFEFTDLCNSTFVLSMPENGLTRQADLSSVDDLEVVFRLGNALLRGRVICGSQPAAAWGSFVSEGQRVDVVNTDADGSFELSGLCPGKWNYDLHQRGAGNAELKGSIELVDGVTEKTFGFAATGEIAGRVEMGEGKPAGDALVIVQRTLDADGSLAREADQVQVVSASDGSFSLGGLEEGAYAVTASKQDAGMAVAEGVQVGKDTPPAQLSLKLSRQGGTLVSKALALETGEPILDAWCRVTSIKTGLTRQAVADASGTIRIRDLPAGTYTAEVSAPWFSLNRRQVTIEDGKTLTIDDVLYGSGNASWTLNDAQGKALAGVACRLVPSDTSSLETERTGSTNANGVWSVQDLAPGVYAATAAVPGKKPVSVTFSVETRQTTSRETKVE